MFIALARCVLPQDHSVLASRREREAQGSPVAQVLVMPVTFFFFFFFCFLFTRLVGYFSMVVWPAAVLSVLYACVLYFCICPCSAHLSIFHMEWRSYTGVCDPYDNVTCSMRTVPQAPGVTYSTQGDWLQHTCPSVYFHCPAKEEGGFKVF